MLLDLRAVLTPSPQSADALCALAVVSRVPAASTSDSRITVDPEGPSHAFELVVRLLTIVWPEAVGFLRMLCRRVTLLHRSDQHWISSSTGEDPFHIVVTMDEGQLVSSAEAVIHELSHLAFYRVESVGPLVSATSSRAYYHPWKSGERPARGALLAAHAFANVAILYQRVAETRVASAERWHREAALMRQQVTTVLDQFTSSGDLTFLGRLVLGELETLAAQ